MPEESYSFAKTRVRLEEIVSQVRKKDTSLEKSLDLLEEGVRLANQCTELIDHADWEAAGATDTAAEWSDASGSGATEESAQGSQSDEDGLQQNQSSAQAEAAPDGGKSEDEIPAS